MSLQVLSYTGLSHVGLPPKMVLRPCIFPESRLVGVTAINVLISRRDNLPHSGASATKEAIVTRSILFILLSISQGFKIRADIFIHISFNKLLFMFHRSKNGLNIFTTIGIGGEDHMALMLNTAWCFSIKTYFSGASQGMSRHLGEWSVLHPFRPTGA